MKYIFIFLLTAFAFYEYIFYIPNSTNSATSPIPVYHETIKETKTELPKTKSDAPVKAKIHFKCDGRQYCSQMHSYEEAKFFLRSCPNTKMDGDGDGIPCERQFRRYD